MKLKTKVILKNETDFWGPGMLELFLRIEKLGSIHMAAQDMHMSYSKCWKLIKRAEKELGYPLLIRRTGGKNGGSSQLTEEGKNFIDSYSALQHEIQETSDRIFRKYFP